MHAVFGILLAVFEHSGRPLCPTDCNGCHGVRYWSLQVRVIMNRSKLENTRSSESLLDGRLKNGNLHREWAW